jgi:hypothetical protein
VAAHTRYATPYAITVCAPYSTGRGVCLYICAHNTTHTCLQPPAAPPSSPAASPPPWHRPTPRTPHTSSQVLFIENHAPTPLLSLCPSEQGGWRGNASSVIESAESVSSGRSLRKASRVPEAKRMPQSVASQWKEGLNRHSRQGHATWVERRPAPVRVHRCRQLTHVACPSAYPRHRGEAPVEVGEKVTAITSRYFDSRYFVGGRCGARTLDAAFSAP